MDKRRYPWLPVGPTADPTDPLAWVTLGAFTSGMLLLGLFVRRSRTVPSPILDLRLFQNPVFRTANVATFFFGAAFMSVTIFLPLFLVNVLGVSATRAGAALIPFSLGIVFGATVSGQIVSRVGYRRQIFLGALVFLACVVLLSRMDADTSYARVTLYMVLCGLGVGPSMPLFTLAVQNAVDVRMVGQATSASQFFRQIGATIGAAVMGTVLGTTLGIAFSAIELPVTVPALRDAAPGEFVSTGGAELPARIRAAYGALARAEPTPAASQALQEEGEEVAARVSLQIREAFTAATRRIYGLTAVLMAVAAVLTLRIPELKLRTTHDRAGPSEAMPP